MPSPAVLTIRDSLEDRYSCLGLVGLTTDAVSLWKFSLTFATDVPKA